MVVGFGICLPQPAFPENFTTQLPANWRPILTCWLSFEHVRLIELRALPAYLREHMAGDRAEQRNQQGDNNQFARGRQSCVHGLLLAFQRTNLSKLRTALLYQRKSPPYAGSICASYPPVNAN